MFPYTYTCILRVLPPDRSNGRITGHQLPRGKLIGNPPKANILNHLEIALFFTDVWWELRFQLLDSWIFE